MLKNKNRGYRQLRVWNNAIEYHRQTCSIFGKFPFELKKVSSQAIASSDSVHRNIAEGYCRRSIHEYLNFLNIAIGSLGESVSGLCACRTAEQISQEEFQILNEKAFKIENGMIKLIESLEQKRKRGDWTDYLLVKEEDTIYELE